MAPVIRIGKSKQPESNESGEPKLKKIRLKSNSGSSASPASKPSTKIRLKLKKRDDSSETAARGSGNAGTSGTSSRPMKLKINLVKREDGAASQQHKSKASSVVKTPKFRIKPVRVPGEGYDSEASDIEDDPLIEEGIVLRVLPDMSAEFVKSSIESGDYSGVSIKWKGERHAVVKVNGVQYGAVLVDLPSIIEVNKSVDRKNLLKTFDVSQMLICLSTISREEDVFALKVSDTEDLTRKHFEEYKKEIIDQRKQQLRGYNDGPLTDAESKNIEQIINKGYDYKHGITPPLYNARNRRFRHKMGPTEFDYVERSVERLLKMDADAEEFEYDLVDEAEYVQQRSPGAADVSQHRKKMGKVEFEDEETDDVEHEAEEDHEEDLELELEQALQLETDAGVPVGAAAAASGKSQLLEETGDDVEQDNGDDDDEEEDEDEDEEEEEEAELSRGSGTPSGGATAGKAKSRDTSNEDEAAQQLAQHAELLRDELKELESTVELNRAKALRATNPLLKTRFLESIKKLEKELELKRKQLGEDDAHTSATAAAPLAANHAHASTDSGAVQAQPAGLATAQHARSDTATGDGAGSIPVAEYEDDEDDEDPDDEDDEDEDQEPEPEAQPDLPPDETQALDQDDMDMMLLFGADND